MAANAPFTSVVGKTVCKYSQDGFKCVAGTAVGPDVAGADTVLDLSSFFAGKVYHLSVTPTTGTTYYLCQPLISSGAPSTIKVNIFAGNDPAQTTSDLKGVSFSWIAFGTDYE